MGGGGGGHLAAVGTRLNENAARFRELVGSLARQQFYKCGVLAVREWRLRTGAGIVEASGKGNSERLCCRVCVCFAAGAFDEKIPFEGRVTNASPTSGLPAW